MARSDGLRKLLNGRPHWMNALMLFCIFMTFIYMPWDIFIKPVAVDQEVWFGFMFTGWAAKATEPLCLSPVAGNGSIASRAIRVSP